MAATANDYTSIRNQTLVLSASRYKLPLRTETFQLHAISCGPASGDLVLFLHGSGPESSAADWREVLHELSVVDIKVALSNWFLILGIRSLQKSLVLRCCGLPWIWNQHR